MEEGLALLSGPKASLRLDALWLFRSLARGRVWGGKPRISERRR